MNRLQAADALVLAATILLPSGLYLGGLGFYSDDWRFLSLLANARDQSLMSLLASVGPDLLVRPPQWITLVLLFTWFGRAPLGYHLANTLILAGGVVGFYLVLREVRVGRALALGVAAVFGALPHYSTDRFWVASLQATIGLAAFFGGTYALLRATRALGALPVWIGCGVVLLTVSGLSYEVFVPPIAVITPAVLLVVGRQRAQRGLWPRSWGLVCLVLAVAAGVVLFKVETSTRIPEFPSLLARVRWFAAVIRDASTLGYGEYGVGLPALTLSVLSRWPDAVRAAVALTLGLATGTYSWAALTRADEQPALRGAKQLTLLGPVVFVLGLAIFTTNYAFLATPSGDANRTAIAATAGIALSLVGGAAWCFKRVAPPAVGAVLFAGVVGGLCFCGVVINATLAGFWVEAAREQALVLSEITSELPSLPTGSTLLLDGICPYVGPGIVFEAPWDLAGALQIAYSDPTLRADIVTPNLRVQDDAVVTEIYGVPSAYPYTSLVMFDAPNRSAVSIPNASVLRDVLARVDSNQGGSRCQGVPAAGASVF